MVKPASESYNSVSAARRLPSDMSVSRQFYGSWLGGAEVLLHWTRVEIDVLLSSRDAKTAARAERGYSLAQG